MPAYHIPSQDLLGPFTGYVANGKGKRRVESESPAFELISQAIQWCHQERARLAELHPRRNWIGTIVGKNHCLCHIPF